MVKGLPEVRVLYLPASRKRKTWRKWLLKCIVCDKEFWAKSRVKKYCTPACYYHVYVWRKK